MAGRSRLVLGQQAAVLLNGGGSVDANRRASVAAMAGRAQAPGADGFATNRCAAGAAVRAGTNADDSRDQAPRRLTWLWGGMATLVRASRGLVVFGQKVLITGDRVARRGGCERLPLVWWIPTDLLSRHTVVRVQAGQTVAPVGMEAAVGTCPADVQRVWPSRKAGMAAANPGGQAVERAVGEIRPRLMAGGHMVAVEQAIRRTTRETRHTHLQVMHFNQATTIKPSNENEVPLHLPPDCPLLSLSKAAGTAGARIWPRTGCSFDGAGRGRCQTGDCNGQLVCSGYGSPPNTLAEYALNQYQNLDFFDISVIDGFNVPMEFSPNSGGCSRGIRCTGDVNGQCPNQLRAPGGCNNPCTVYKTNEYCCNTGAPSSRGFSSRGAPMHTVIQRMTLQAPSPAPVGPTIGSSSAPEYEPHKFSVSLHTK
ncbi:hypothetical protein SASPL_134011 [Salvia splendens]|uniref:Uncharacterized protein n=1 Tax=Salvia splendens TaxID=180675 RepID=A0A8X8X6S5_SALSN|nr:hypothetical protein SASPL_134011 [Salvia splendens]